MTLEYRNQIIQNYLGKLVHVEIDRPAGYLHGGILYPVNYGYIPGLTAGDGEEQDAYILGVTEPLASFDGQVIGAIRRMNDCEDKLVVAPVGMHYHQGEIAGAVHFQEQFFETKVESLFRKSCGVIPFRWNGETKEYLLVLQSNDCWSFPKGHMEPGEQEEETALRELLEETGLRAKLIPGKRVVYEYGFAPCHKKQVVFFLGQAEGEFRAQASEVRDHRWITAEEVRLLLHQDTCEACAELLR